ncbi:hypothetical protein ACFX2H_012279 [Malus domestica]
MDADSSEKSSSLSLPLILGEEQHEQAGSKRLLSTWQWCIWAFSSKDELGRTREPPWWLRRLPHTLGTLRMARRIFLAFASGAIMCSHVKRKKKAVKREKEKGIRPVFIHCAYKKNNKKKKE